MAKKISLLEILGATNENDRMKKSALGRYSRKRSEQRASAVSQSIKLKYPIGWIGDICRVI
ncbi:MAG: hypothetical protein Q8R88_12135, partial [Desulfoprunum sp.]|nr:hypothetical protein [Desulfoprunum sp.]